jgi:predicted small integral membrane protein
MARKKAIKKEIVEKISTLKKIINISKAWLKGNGIEGILGLVLGLLLWSFGYKVYAGFAFGVFATRNWDLAKSSILKLIK